jgi:subtilisin family serine protease
MKHFYIVMVTVALLPGISSFVMAQSGAYYYGWNGEIVELTELPGQRAVKFIGESEQDVRQSLSHPYEIRHADHIKHRNTGTMYRLVFDEHIAAAELNTELQANDRIVVPVYNGGSQVLVPTPVFSLYLPDLSMVERMELLNREFGVEVVHEYKSVPGMFSLRIKNWSESDVFAMSRTYFEHLNANWSAPSFFRNWERFGSVEDPYFQYQYYMHQIDAGLAWYISKGDDDVIVAVIDDGVMAHEDLPSSRIVAGYDYGNNNGAPGGNEAHGMAVSGIIAASHNSLGIAGLAPKRR